MMVVWVVSEDGSEDVPRGVLGVYAKKSKAMELVREELAAADYNPKSRYWSHSRTRWRGGIAESWFNSITGGSFTVEPWNATP